MGPNTGQRASLRLLRHIGENKLVVQTLAFATVARDGRLMSTCTKTRGDEPCSSLVVLDHQTSHAADLAE